MKDGGLIHIYCGDGKGKTTAALGLALRCSGHGNHVLLVQFLKSRPTGELKSLALLPNIQVMRGKETKKFTFQMNDDERTLVPIKGLVWDREVIDTDFLFTIKQAKV